MFWNHLGEVGVLAPRIVHCYNLVQQGDPGNVPELLEGLPLKDMDHLCYAAWYSICVPVSDKVGGLLLNLLKCICILAVEGTHTVDAYSKLGLTTAVYAAALILDEASPRLRLKKPGVLFPLATVLLML